MIKQIIALIIKGMVVGGCNVVPGVSGGTVALLLGIYRRLIEALHSVFAKSSWNLLFKGQFKLWWQKIQGGFLLAIFIGVFLGLLVFARLLNWAFELYESLTLALFLGMIIAAAWYLLKSLFPLRRIDVLWLIIGLVVSLSLFFMPVLSENSSPLYLVLCGVVAMISMVIPGLSGSYLLLLLGNYTLMLEAINNLSQGAYQEAFAVLGWLFLGCFVGLIGMVKFLAWLLKHYERALIANVSGFVLGSMLLLWPFKQAKEMLDGKVVSYEYLPLDLMNPQHWLAITLFIIGAALIVLLQNCKPKIKATKESN